MYLDCISKYIIPYIQLYLKLFKTRYDAEYNLMLLMIFVIDESIQNLSRHEFDNEF